MPKLIGKARQRARARQRLVAARSIPYRSGPRLSDDDIEALSLLMGQLRQGPEAAKLALTAIEHLHKREPNNYQAIYAHTAALMALNRFEEALAEIKRVRKDGTPAFMQAVRNARYACFYALGRYEEALAETEVRIKLDADVEPIIPIDTSLGTLLAQRGDCLVALRRYEDAKVDLDRAMALAPEQQNVNIAYAALALTSGDYARGLPCYERRNKEYWPSGAALWNGEADLTGRSIFLRHESGLGESLSMARYVRPLVERGADVTFETQPKLMNVAWNFPEGVRLHECDPLGDRPMPRCDFEIPILSLPYAMQTRVDSIPMGSLPHVAAPTERLDYWRDRLPAGPKVAIGWTGRYQIDFAGQNRSVPLDEIEKILGTPGVSFVSVERFLDAETADRLTSRYNFTHVGDAVSGDLADMAAVLELSDHVISCDNTTACLAGAMGKPTSVMLAYSAEWHYGDGDVWPWFPSARLFRQPTHGDWADVGARVKEAIS
jgi:tetratricopeptide (TPR) repeat protein